MSLTKFQTRVVAIQIAEIRRVIDVSNTRGLGNRCGVFTSAPTSETLQNRTDQYLNAWVEIPLSKIEQVLTVGEDGTWSKEELLRT